MNDENILTIARELTEKLYNDHDSKFNHEHFIMFMISNFILLKEKILKKDCHNKILHFDNVKLEKFIDPIIKLYDELIKNAQYIKQSNKIVLTKDDGNQQKLKDALLFLQIIRDSLAHGMYKIDVKNDLIVVDNDHSMEKPPYKLKCAIPVQILNFASFYFDQLNANKTPTVGSFHEYNNRLAKKYNIDLEKYNNVNINLEKYNDVNKVANKMLSFKNYNNINNNIKIGFTKTSDNIIDKLEQDVSLKDFYKLVRLLIKYVPKNVQEKEEVSQILKNLNDYFKTNKNRTNYDAKTKRLMEEMRAVLGIKKSNQNRDALCSLYNYMCLAFSKVDSIDYAHLHLSPITVYFDNSKSGRVSIFNDINASINNLCNNFIMVLQKQITDYKNNANDKFRHALMMSFVNFYNKIMLALAGRNEQITSSIRNSCEHGNYIVDGDKVILCDQDDHSNDEDIKFVCCAKGEDFLHFINEVSSSNNEYSMLDFYNELTLSIDEECKKNLMKVMNDLSLIIFGKDLKLEYSMEKLLKEALTQVLSKYQKTK